MDKVIDGLDVSGCINIDEWEHCNICQVLIKTIPNRHQCLTEGDLRCEFYPNCYYKQLQRLKEELRTERIHSSQIEELEGSLQHAKAENEKLKIDIGIYKGIIDSDKEENERLKQEWRLDCLKCEYKNTKADVDKYKQALQEIRELIKKLDLSLGCAYGDYDCDNCSDINEETVCKIKLQNIILDKINEVIGAEE